MEIQVTQEHINRAIEARDSADGKSFRVSENCPVAQALKDAGIEFDAVAYVTVEKLERSDLGDIQGIWEVGKLSENAKELTILFAEQWESAEPMTIEYTPLY